MTAGMPAATRDELHTPVDALPDTELGAARRLLGALRETDPARKARSQDRAFPERVSMQQPAARPRYVLCLRNDGYPASLEPRRVYEALADSAAEARHHMRDVDESGEDYLYPDDFFVPIDLPREAERAFMKAS
jgi:hypothetical protein